MFGKPRRVAQRRGRHPRPQSPPKNSQPRQVSRQRRREAKRETRNANASVVIPFPSASRRLAHQKGERKVKTAASDFINAILKVSAGLVADEHAAILSARIGRYQAPTFIASFDPPPARGPDNLFPRGDRSGRVVVIWQDERGDPHKWSYERRSRALARLTAPERQAFFEAVRACPGAAPEAVHEVRAAFAFALRGVRGRDAVMMM